MDLPPVPLPAVKSPPWIIKSGMTWGRWGGGGGGRVGRGWGVEGWRVGGEAWGEADVGAAARARERVLAAAGRCRERGGACPAWLSPGGSRSPCSRSCGEEGWAGGQGRQQAMTARQAGGVRRRSDTPSKRAWQPARQHWHASQQCRLASAGLTPSRRCTGPGSSRRSWARRLRGQGGHSARSCDVRCWVQPAASGALLAHPRQPPTAPSFLPSTHRRTGQSPRGLRAVSQGWRGQPSRIMWRQGVESSRVR